MGIEILQQMPEGFFSGDTLKVRFAGNDFPSPGWVLTLCFSGDSFFSSVGAEDNGGHLVTVKAEDTKDRKPGVYAWSARVENADKEQATLLSGAVWIKPDPTGQTKSYAQTCLELIEAHIQGRLPAGLESHTIGGNPISKIPLLQAEKLRTQYQAEVYQEKRARLEASSGNSNSGIRIEFSR